MALLRPDLYYSSVHAIDLDALAQEGVNVLLIDLDNTLLPRDTNEITEEHHSWARAAAEKGFGVCLVSNNWHERVQTVADELEFAIVSKAVKPLPFAFFKALKKMGAKRSEAAMIGDQVFTDILGGNLLQMRTILVEPLSQTDLPHTLLLRRMEGVLLAGRKPLA